MSAELTKYDIARKLLIVSLQKDAAIAVDMLDKGSRDFELLRHVIAEYADKLAAVDVLACASVPQKK